jgi:hypothetical protein
MPPRTVPILCIMRGATHVALNSNSVLTVRANPTWSALYPIDTKYVIICPEKDSTVKYRMESEKDGRKAGCRK